MPIGSGDKTFWRSHLHGDGTISPDWIVPPGDPGGDIGVPDSFHPSPPVNPAIDAIPAARAAVASDAAGDTGATDPTAPTGASLPSGLVILANYDTSITNLQTSSPTLYAAVTGAITAAVNFYETNITNQITLSINFGWGEVGGVNLGAGALGSSRLHDSLQLQSYSEVRSLLATAATSADDKSAINKMPTSDPTGGGNFFIANSELKALGLGAFTSGADGSVGLSSTASFAYDPANRAVSGEYDAIGVLEHEISEVMGRLESLSTLFGGSNEYTPMDLFRYSSAGTRDLTPGAGYFSVDGGTTDLDPFNNPGNGGDAGDWANSVANDSYDAFSSSGVANIVSATDLRLMDVLGYTLASAASGPIVTAGGTVTFTGGGAAVTLDTGLTVSDASSTTLASGTVTIGGFITGDTLTVGTPGSLATSFSNGTLTLSGIASLATYQTALDSIAYSFNPANGDPTGGGSHTSRTISWSVNDGTASSGASSSTLDTVHAAPTITTSGTVAFTQGGPAITLDSGLAVADPDSNGNIGSATVAVAGGAFATDGDTLSANTAGTAITASYTAATETLTLTGADTIADYQAVLRSITFSSTGAAAGTRTIDWTLNDGVSNSTTSTSKVTVHDQPIVAAAGTVSFSGGGTGVTLDSGLVVTDASSTTLSSGTVIIGGFITGDTLTVGTPGSLATSFSNGTLTLSGIASLATYQTALDSIAYSFNPANGDPTGGGSHTSRTISWSVNDGVASSTSGNRTLDTIYAAPTAIAGASVSYTENGAPVPLDLGLIVSDPDSGGSLIGATISISSGFLIGDLLNFTSQNGIVGIYDGAGALTLSGVATVPDYQAALQSVSYSFVGDPTNGGADTSRTISWTVTDGAGSSSPPVTSSLALHGAVLGGSACYCRGTRILTDHGELAVEHLRIGDRVATVSGTARPIRWIGYRSLDLTRHPSPGRVQPIVIRANGVADGVPRRDLRISPDHAVLLDGALIMARWLVNGVSIECDVQCKAVTYYHIELETHDILLAEGLPAESYLDTGNRRMFENADVPLILHPDLEDGQQQRIARSCRLFVDDAAMLEPIWRRLAMRASLLGLDPPAALQTSDDPALHVVLGGQSINPASVAAGRYVFVLPRIDGPVRLVSRAARPCDARPWVLDNRRLGVAVSRLTLKQGADVVPVALDDPRCSEGWWELERGRDRFWRWTDGDASLGVTCGWPAMLVVELAGTLDYPVGALPCAGPHSGNVEPIDVHKPAATG